MQSDSQQYYATRIGRLRAELDRQDIGAVLVNGEYNVTYLTGFSGEASSLLVTPDTLRLITDFRYQERAKAECPWLALEVRDRTVEDLGPCVARLLGPEASKGLAFESGLVSHAFYEALTRSLDPKLLHPTIDLVESFRKIKDSSEVKAMGRAAALGDQAFEYMLGRLAPGRSEVELAFELEQYLRMRSGEELAFTSILVSGEKTAQPHGNQGERKLQMGDFVTLDFGSKSGGYCSDMTRTVMIGQPDERQREVYETVREAQSAAVQAVRAGIRASELAGVADTVLSRAGYAQYSGDGLGHGIGLFVHEKPIMRSSTPDRLEAGMVVTVEPGIYIPEWGGVRIEDMVHITRTGCEVLTHAPKELITL